jgi:hypothetical protein
LANRGEGIESETMDDLAAYVHQIGREVSAEVAAADPEGTRACPTFGQKYLNFSS